MTINKYTADDLHRHARDLAKAWTVRLIVSDELKPEEAFGQSHLRAVFTAPIIEETTYAVVLHEIGHLASPTGVVRPQLGATGDAFMLEEESAWAWARHYALDWTPAMEAVAAWALGTYRDMIAEAHKKNAARKAIAIAEILQRRQPEAQPAPAPAPTAPINWNDWK